MPRLASPRCVSHQSRYLIKLPGYSGELLAEVERTAMPSMPDFLPARANRVVVVRQRIHHHARNVLGGIPIRFMNHVALDLVEMRRREDLALEARLENLAVAFRIDDQDAIPPLQCDIGPQPGKELRSPLRRPAVYHLCANNQLGMLSREVLKYKVLEKRMKLLAIIDPRKAIIVPLFAHQKPVRHQIAHGHEEPVATVVAVVAKPAPLDSVRVNDRDALHARKTASKIAPAPQLHVIARHQKLRTCSEDTIL